jgi:hypothetical protein
LAFTHGLGFGLFCLRKTAMLVFFQKRGNSMIRILAALLCLSASAQAAQVYVCTSANGQKTYQQQPCRQSVKMEVKNYEAVVVGTDMPALDIEAGKKEQAQAAQGREAQRIEQKITEYQTSMQTELAQLKARKALANNNLAGATLEESISTEMQAVTNKWSVLIQAEQNKLKALQAKP